MSLQRFGKSLHSQKKNLWKHNLHNTGNVRVSLSPLSLLSTDNGRYSAGRFAWPTFLAACKTVFRSHLSDIAVYHRTWMLWGGWATQVAGWVRLHLLFTEPAQGDFTEVHLAGSSMPALLGSWALPYWGTDKPLPPKKGENTGFPVGSWKVLLSRHREMPAPRAKGEGYTRPPLQESRNIAFTEAIFVSSLVLSTPQIHPHQAKRWNYPLHCRTERGEKQM